jgi:hypothetical protein
MSSIFSFSRLGKLIIKQLFENGRLYIFSTLAGLGLMALFFTFWGFTSAPVYNEDATYLPIFLVGLFVGGSVFASMSFNMLGSKDKGIYWLSVPATHLEKLVCTIFYTTIVFTIVYCLCFFVVKSIAVPILLEYIKSHPGFRYVATDWKGETPNIFWNFIRAYFAVQALYILGSVYFQRYAFIVTTVVGATLIFTFIYYASQIEQVMFKGLDWQIVSVKKYNEARDSYYFYSISPTLGNTLKYILQYAWAPLFWVVTWFRLKEKEI